MVWKLSGKKKKKSKIATDYICEGNKVNGWSVGLVVVSSVPYLIVGLLDKLSLRHATLLQVPVGFAQYTPGG